MRLPSDTASGNGAPIGGLKVVTEQDWFAARPSDTEDVYKLDAESFRGPDHLRRIQEEAQALIAKALAALKQAQPLLHVWDRTCEYVTNDI